ncbi:hypothetical protein ACFXD5_12155 [Streptomyces sp. NPDC059385]|uniref:hypothetical protein n=1 Tax=Streptomyces sp. NPDC059385 TaxID=3346817 RepID=UPI0036B7E4CE
MNTFTHTLADGTAVTATEPAPGLRVYPVDPNHGTYDYTWEVGHHSGRSIAACDEQEDAEHIAQEIADFTDWTRSADDIRADTSLDRRHLRDWINNSTYGTFLHDDPIAD